MIKKHCCEYMTKTINNVCSQHSDPFECPDKIIYFESKFEEYGIIIRDGGRSYSQINFCPWCGKKLPECKRDLWFDTLCEMGFDDPYYQDIPEEFKSGEWFKG